LQGRKEEMERPGNGETGTWKNEEKKGRKGRSEEIKKQKQGN